MSNPEEMDRAALIALSLELLSCLTLLNKMTRDGDVTSDVLEECDAVINKSEVVLGLKESA